MSAPKARKPKIKVRKPLSHQVQVDPQYRKKTWSLLQTSIQHIHEQNASGLSFEELYRNAYTMVLHKHGDFLYSGVKSTVREHLDRVAESLLAVPDAEFLAAMRKAWRQHKTSQLMIRDILMYMNSVYVPVNNVPGVYEMGLLLFRDQVARSPEIKRRLLDQLLAMIQREREGEVVDRSIIKSATSMLVELGCGSRQIYEDDFETPFLESTAQALRTEAASRLSTDGAPAYLQFADRRLNGELARVQQVLDISSEARVRIVAERELVGVHLQTLIDMDTGLVSMLKVRKFTDLRTMYTLYARVAEGHDAMRQVLLAYLKQMGSAIVEDGSETAVDPDGHEEDGPEDQSTFVDALLGLRDEADQWLAKAFRGDKKFGATCNQAFEHFINASPKSPEYLSLYIDNKLRRGLKNATEDEVEQSLERAMSLFRYLHEKDVFEKYYKQHLARRLLLARSVSDDAERAMISKLKSEVGFQFTSKLEGMFQDVRTSVDINEQFQSYVQGIKERGEDDAAWRKTVKDGKNKDGVDVLKDIVVAGGKSLDSVDPFVCDISVQVLTTGYWPLQSVNLCALPPTVAAAAALFKTFYLHRFSGRILTYQTNMGTADIKAMFAAKRHELSVSTYQMVLLYHFNAAKIRSAKELRELSGISQRDLWRNLATLCSARHRILLRKRADPSKQGPNDADQFMPNAKFRSKLYKIRIGGSAAVKEEPAQLAETRAKVEEDRKHQIEAAIVRIMKSRRSLSHNELISEVIKLLQARFLPNPQVIKKRIESLIEREFLERAAGSMNMYLYLP